MAAEERQDYAEKGDTLRVFKMNYQARSEEIYKTMDPPSTVIGLRTWYVASTGLPRYDRAREHLENLLDMELRSCAGLRYRDPSLPGRVRVALDIFIARFVESGIVENWVRYVCLCNVLYVIERICQAHDDASLEYKPGCRESPRGRSSRDSTPAYKEVAISPLSIVGSKKAKPARPAGLPKPVDTVRTQYWYAWMMKCSGLERF